MLYSWEMWFSNVRKRHHLSKVIVPRALPVVEPRAETNQR